jgi:hypothetical protein
MIPLGARGVRCCMSPRSPLLQIPLSGGENQLSINLDEGTNSGGTLFLIGGVINQGEEISAP